MKKYLLVLLVILVSAGPVFCGEFEDILEFENILEMAEQESAVAQYVLGSMYHHGEGIPQDYKQAVYWYTKSAEQGDVSAQYNLESWVDV